MVLFALVRSLERQQASQAAGFVAVTIGTAALIGWWAGLPLLSSWASGFATVKPSTAWCLTALGAALVHPGKNLRFAFAVGLAVAAVAALDLCLDLFGVELGIDRLQSSRSAVLGQGAALVPMPHATSLGLVLASGSLALSRFERHRLAATMLGSLAGATSVFVLLGYLIGIDTLYDSASASSPALPTFIGLLCVAGAIVLRIGTMPVLRKSRPLWHLLVMLGCAIVAPLLLFGAYAGFRIADAQVRDVQEGLSIEARTLSTKVDGEIIGEIETAGVGGLTVAAPRGFR